MWFLTLHLPHFPLILLPLKHVMETCYLLYTLNQQMRKFLRVFAERGEKDLRGAHPQSVENGERVLVHLPQK